MPSLQQSCMLMASVISSIGLSRKPLVSPGKVSTPIAETLVGQVEMSDSFNTSYLLGKACRTVFHNSQVRCVFLRKNIPLQRGFVSHGWLI